MNNRDKDEQPPQTHLQSLGSPLMATSKTFGEESATQPLQPGVKNSKTRKARLGKLVSVLAVNLVVFAFLDFCFGLIYFQIIFPRSDPLTVQDAVLGFRTAPNQATWHKWPEHPAGGFVKLSNNYGLPEDQDYSLSKPADVFRVIVVGDSHTAGTMAPNETFAGQLEDLVGTLNGKRVEVINAGQGRYSPYQSYLLLKHELLAFNPDVVVVAVYAGNDFFDMLRFDDRPSLSIQNGELIERPAEFMVYDDPPLPFWSNNSLVYKLYRQHLRYYVTRSQYILTLVDSLGGNVGDAWEILWPFSLIKHKGIISQSLVQTVFFSRFPTARESAMQLTEQVVELHQELAEENDYHVFFVLIPSRIQIEPDLDRARVEAAFATANLDKASQETDDNLSDEFASMLGRRQVPLVDPRNALREASRSESPVYWSRDYHINIKGARIVAELLAQHLIATSVDGQQDVARPGHLAAD